MQRSTVNILFLILLVSMTIGLGASAPTAVCADLAGIWLLKNITSKDVATLPALLCPSELQRLVSGPNASTPWQYGFIEYMQGDLRRAEVTLSSSLAGWDDIRRTMLMDAMMWAAPIAWQVDPVRAEFAVNFVRAHGQASPRGYLILANFYREQAQVGDPRWLKQAQEVLQLAASAPIPHSKTTFPRAEAWFWLGEWAQQEKNEQQAVEYYRAALRDDPRDDSWGFAWMSAMQLVEIYTGQQNWSEARTLLAYAETLPDRYHRYSHTRLRLARLEAGLGSQDLAIRILEDTIRKDSSFVLTRLYLAELYLQANSKSEAIVQYQTVLALDPNQAQARQALATLEGK